MWEKALQASSDRKVASLDSRGYEAGGVMGPYEAVSLLKAQAEVFGLDARLGLPEAEPEELL